MGNNKNFLMATLNYHINNTETFYFPVYYDVHSLINNLCFDIQLVKVKQSVILKISAIFPQAT